MNPPSEIYNLQVAAAVGAELFTGNNLMAMAWWERKIGVGGLLRNLAVVWLANLAGSVLLAAIVSGSGQWAAAGGALGAYTVKVAAGKAALAPAKAFCSGILCNILVCLAILAAASSKQTVGKIFAIWFPIMAFVLGGFEHSVANMYYIPAGLLANAARNLLFVTLGNLAGGVLFTAALWGRAQRPVAR